MNSRTNPSGNQWEECDATWICVTVGGEERQRRGGEEKKMRVY